MEVKPIKHEDVVTLMECEYEQSVCDGMNYRANVYKYVLEALKEKGENAPPERTG